MTSRISNGWQLSHQRTHSTRCHWRHDVCSWRHGLVTLITMTQPIDNCCVSLIYLSFYTWHGRQPWRSSTVHRWLWLYLASSLVREVADEAVNNEHIHQAVTDVTTSAGDVIFTTTWPTNNCCVSLICLSTWITWGWLYLASVGWWSLVREVADDWDAHIHHAATDVTAAARDVMVNSLPSPMLLNQLLISCLITVVEKKENYNNSTNFDKFGNLQF